MYNDRYFTAADITIGHLGALTPSIPFTISTYEIDNYEFKKNVFTFLRESRTQLQNQNIIFQDLM